jgi:tRNA-modifying protein YgfZ
MDDNLPPVQAATFALPGYSILAIEGADAVRFAHAQFMSDVAALADGHWHWSGWLTPKGRVIALFALLRFDAQSLWLLLPDADAHALRTALQRFVFRSKVVLTALENRHVSGNFAAPSIASGARFAGSMGNAVELDVGTTASPRALYVRQGAVRIDAGSAASWDAYDLVHGLPRLSSLQAGQWTPQQLSLDRLRAYSVKKGCYPGQEIVARTHFLGQAKRGLALFDAKGEVADGIEVRFGEKTLGTVVSVATHAASSIVLAVLPLERDPKSMPHAGNIELLEQALLEGLAR